MFKSVSTGMESTSKIAVTLAMLCFSTYSYASSEPSLTMKHFIGAVEQIEESNPSLGPLAVLSSLRRTYNQNDVFSQYLLRELNTTVAVFNSSLELSEFLHHEITREGQEMGVVLGTDGTTVAPAPLLLGLEAGLLAASGSPPQGLHMLTLALSLGLSFLRSHLGQTLGPDGCWNNLTSPRVFSLSGPPSLATNALINGGMDGSILGEYLSNLSGPPMNLSVLLREYYLQELGDTGLDMAPHRISARRRENFGAMLNSSELEEQVLRSLALHRRLSGENGAELDEGAKEAVRVGVHNFFLKYIDCPAIIPRCMWDARPYRGTPSLLKLPLAFLFIHHTETPSKPCVSFPACARHMRSMQHFHQYVRGWNDIGYSFVVGSNGYVYEGRGWHWLGAHTRGQNSRGYGISFIGSYTKSIPSHHSLMLVRDRLASCAVNHGYLLANYTLHGHRQVVNTTCPGDALFAEIQSWEHFREVYT